MVQHKVDPVKFVANLSQPALVQPNFNVKSTSKVTFELHAFPKAFTFNECEMQ